MEFNIRQLEYQDYNTLVEWWSDWGLDSPDRDFLPEDGIGGLIITDGDIPVCAGFIYNTNSKVAWVDWIVSNKQYRVKGKRKEAILLLIDSLTNICKNTAHKYIFSNNNNRFLVDYFVENGYIVGCKNSVELIKKF
jgi:hypothetical protein